MKDITGLRWMIQHRYEQVDHLFREISVPKIQVHLMRMRPM